MMFGTGPAWHLAGLLLAIVSPVVGALLFYWVIRLAVRHGIEDAWRRRGRSSETETGWDPARH